MLTAADLGTQGGWWDLVERRATVTPDRLMLTDEGGRALTFAGFRDAAERVAAGLADLGVTPSMRVSWQLPTVMEAAVLMAALSRLGVVQNPIIPILRRAEVDHIVGQIGCDLLITPAVWRGFDFASMAHEIAEVHGIRTLVVDHTTVGREDLALPVGDPGGLAPLLGDADAVRWIYYSSGTTAAPKGAKHSDRSVMAGSNGPVDYAQWTRDDLFPLAFPITHVGGHTCVTAQLRVGSQVLLIEAFDAQRSPLVMAERGATILGSAPPFFHAYFAAEQAHGSEPLFPKLRTGMGGGAACPPELHYETKRVLGGLGVIVGWGLTEFPIATQGAVGDPDVLLAETVGRACRDVEIRVVGADGADQPPGAEGELRIRGPQMLLGYVDRALDADAFDELGYFCTGDLGTVDPEGNVRITGRIKDIIIRNAENISATEVENVLYLHPAIGDVAVVGIPDPRTSERCCAVVVPAPGAEPLSLQAIGEHCREHGLANQKIPERLDIFEVLPRNALGKLLKQEIRAQVIKRSMQEDPV